jgi:hypothetical protein
MAQDKAPAKAVTAPAQAKAKKPAVDKKARQVGTLLKDIGALYREAAIAYMADETVTYKEYRETIAAYDRLVDRLVTNSADEVTSKGLDAVDG